MPKKKINYANRGMQLEGLIDKTNDRYKEFGVADVRKVPTPFKVIGRAGTMSKGFFMTGEWVDYLGVSHDKVLVFDAKQTAGKSLPLANIKEHQFELLESWNNYGAECFLIVYFSDFEKYYYLNFDVLNFAWNRMLEGGRKSISLIEFEGMAKEINYDGDILDYLNKA